MKIEWQILFVAVGGALGALTRYGISHTLTAVIKHPFPWGTLVANLVGCFLVGLLVGSGLDDKSHAARTGLGIGYLGALTTFSTFSAETMGHVQRDQWWLATGNVTANVVVGLVAVFLGMALGKRML